MKMKIVLMMLVAMVATTQAEMLVNTGFEAGSYSSKGWPDSWYNSYTDTAGLTWHSTGGRGGGKMVQLQTYTWGYSTWSTALSTSVWTSGWGQAYLFQAVTPITAGEDYTFSLWAKSAVQGTPANPGLYVTFMTDSWSYLDYGWASPTNGLYNTITVGDDWTQINFEAWTAPEGATLAFFCLGARVSESGSILYDDVSMTLVPEPVTLSLLGLGALMLRRRK